MRVNFTDFYGQKVEVNNETASGNIRLKVNTCEDLNDCRNMDDEDFDKTKIIETDISLDDAELKILLGALEKMERS